MNIVNVNNILLIFILFISTTFTNVTFAFDGWFSPDQARCKVEYTRMNLVTGVEIRKKHTYQDDDWRNYPGENCSTYARDLAIKIENWLLESGNNILVDISAMYCKTRTDDGIFSNKWSEYEQCGASDSWWLLTLATELKGQQNQKGYNAHEDRIKGLVWEEGGIYNEPYDD
jgi:hypothetical protein